MLLFKILFYTCLVLVTSGCTHQIAFNELTKDIPADYKVRMYVSKQLNYSISVPKRFGFPENQIGDTLSMEMFRDTTKLISEGVSKLVVAKYHFKGIETKLKNVWNRLNSKRPILENYRMYSEGTTSFFSFPAYYEHAVYTIGGKKYESICILFRGETSRYFAINLEVIRDKYYEVNMKELLYCTKTIKILTN